jgi:hypothetical protein
MGVDDLQEFYKKRDFFQTTSIENFRELEAKANSEQQVSNSVIDMPCFFYKWFIHDIRSIQRFKFERKFEFGAAINHIEHVKTILENGATTPYFRLDGPLDSHHPKTPTVNRRHGAISNNHRAAIEAELLLFGKFCFIVSLGLQQNPFLTKY